MGRFLIQLRLRAILLETATGATDSVPEALTIFPWSPLFITGPANVTQSGCTQRRRRTTC